MTAVDILVVYIMFLRRKTYKHKRSCKYIKSTSSGKYTLSLSLDSIKVNNISYSEKDIYSVFLLKDYIAFVLNNNQSLIVKTGEAKSRIYDWLGGKSLNIYTWTDDPAGALAMCTRL